MDYAEHLIERIVAAPDHSRVDVLANELLREFNRGYPVERLRTFLRSDDENLLSTGLWITSELGERGKQLISDTFPLLRHPTKRVRFWALDCLLWASASDGKALASGIDLMDDPEPAVRWKALDFLSRASRGQLGAALSYLSDTQPNSEYTHGLRWLLDSGANETGEVVSALKQNDDPVVRRYGAVAAARMSEQNPEPLVYASSIDDGDVSDFARGWLGSLPNASIDTH